MLEAIIAIWKVYRARQLHKQIIKCSQKRDKLNEKQAVLTRKYEAVSETSYTAK